MRFVDTNVLLYAVSKIPEESDKRRTAISLLQQSASDIALSAQVLQEFSHQATRASRPGALTHTEAVEYVYSLQRFHIEPITAELVLRALTICQRFGVSYWDAAILAAAQLTGCDVVYSEDLSHTQDYDGIRVQNPFAPSQAPQPSIESPGTGR